MPCDSEATVADYGVYFETPHNALVWLKLAWSQLPTIILAAFCVFWLFFFLLREYIVIHGAPLDTDHRAVTGLSASDNDAGGRTRPGMATRKGPRTGLEHPHRWANWTKAHVV